VRKKYFLLGRLGQSRQNKNLLYRHDEPNEPTKDPIHLLSPDSPQFQGGALLVKLTLATSSLSTGSMGYIFSLLVPIGQNKHEESKTRKPRHNDVGEYFNGERINISSTSSITSFFYYIFSEEP
jgi:hypothetical protein